MLVAEPALHCVRQNPHPVARSCLKTLSRPILRARRALDTRQSASWALQTIPFPPAFPNLEPVPPETPSSRVPQCLAFFLQSKLSLSSPHVLVACACNKQLMPIKVGRSVGRSGGWRAVGAVVRAAPCPKDPSTWRSLAHCVRYSVDMRALCVARAAWHAGQRHASTVRKRHFTALPAAWRPPNSHILAKPGADPSGRNTAAAAAAFASAARPPIRRS